MKGRSIAIPKVVLNPLAQGLEVPSDLSVCQNSRNDGVERVKGERDRLQEEVNAYRLEKRKLQ